MRGHQMFGQGQGHSCMTSLRCTARVRHCRQVQNRERKRPRENGQNKAKTPNERHPKTNRDAANSNKRTRSKNGPNTPPTPTTATKQTTDQTERRRPAAPKGDESKRGASYDLTGPSGARVRQNV